MRLSLSSVKTQIAKIRFERVCSIVCFIAAATFLIIALMGAWRYIFISAICLAASAIVNADSDDKKPKSQK